MADEKVSEEDKRRADEAFLAMGDGIKELNRVVAEGGDAAQIRAAGDERLSREPLIKEWLVTRGLRHMSELDDAGRAALTDHMKLLNEATRTDKPAAH